MRSFLVGHRCSDPGPGGCTFQEHRQWRVQRAEFDQLRYEVQVLRASLERSGLLGGCAFEAEMHRVRFANMKRDYPLCNPTASLCHTLAPPELALLVAKAAGPPGTSQLRYASRVIAASMEEVMPRVDRDFPRQLIICGGYDGFQSLSSAERMDPESGTWEPLQPMSQRRNRAACAVVAGKLHVAGGNDGDLFLRSAERFDPLVASWEELPPLRSARAHAMSAATRNGFYVFGGIDDVSFLASGERFDTDKSAWDPLPEMWESRKGASVAVLPNGAVWACGGFNGDCDLRLVESFDPSAWCWHRQPKLRQGRRSATAALVGGQLLVCGGNTGAQVLTSVEILAPGATAWDELPPMATPRRRAAAVAVGRALYVFGGVSEDGRTSSAERYDMRAGTWRPLPPMCAPRSGAAVASVAGGVYVIGGMEATVRRGSAGRFSTGGGASTWSRKVERFDLEEMLWKRLPDTGCPRSSFASAVLRF